MRSKNGYHIKVKLFIPTTLKNSLWIRFTLNDDPLRILFDFFRIMDNEDNLDILWDSKSKKSINSVIGVARHD